MVWKSLTTCVVWMGSLEEVVEGGNLAWVPRGYVLVLSVPCG